MSETVTILHNPPCTPGRIEATAGSLVLRWLRPETGEITPIVCYEDAEQVAYEIGRDLGAQIAGAYWVRPDG